MSEIKGVYRFLYQPLNNVVKHPVLGSPITLEVVVRAIRQSLLEQQQPADIYMKGISYIADVWARSGEIDNYDQQSEECKQFIGSLLGV